MSGPLACALVSCGAIEDVRWFLPGPRCPQHTPSKLAGQPEPDALLAEHRRRIATTKPEEN